MSGGGFERWALAGCVGVAGLVIYVLREQSAGELEAALESLEAAPVVVVEEAGAGGAAQGQADAAAVEVDGAALYARVVGPFEAKFATLGRERLGEVFEGVDAVLAELGVDELEALLEQDPDLSCSESYLLAATPDEEIVEAGVLVRALRLLFQKAPRRAVELAVSSGAAGEERGDVELHNLVWRGLGEWAKRDPEAAEAFVDARVDDLYMGEIKRYLMWQAYAEHDLAGALRTAQARGQLRESMAYLSRSVRAENVHVFFEMAAELPEVGAYRSQYFGDFAKKLVHSEGWLQARSFIDRYRDEVHSPGSLALQAAVEDVREQPAEKAAWLAEFGGGADETGARMGRFVQAWAAVDVGEVDTWLGTVAGEPWRDAAVGAFVETVVEHDAALAAQWAGRIEDAGVRERLLERLAD